MPAPEKDPRLAEIAQLLTAYVAASDREHRDLLGMHALLATARPCDRDQYDPGHFTASAFVVAPEQQRALLIEHPTLKLWLQPGGHIELSDITPLAAAQREVVEETGIRFLRFGSTLFDVDVHEIPARGSAPAHRHFDLRFLGYVEGLPSPRSAEGIRTAWVPLSQIEQHSTDVSVHRMARKYLATRA